MCDEFTISKSSELAGLAQLVNQDKDFNGKTIKLIDDLNLNNKEQIPIGRNADSTNKFKGKLEGNNKTIKNLLVEDLSTDYHAAGFFGALNGEVKNLHFENVIINSISHSDRQTDNGTAVVAGSINSEGYIENVSVKNAQITGNRYIGGIAGYFVDEGKHSIENNVVKDTTITAYRDFGGIVGASNTVNYIKNNTADNITLLINNEHNYKKYNSIEAHLVSGIVGRIITNGVIDSSNKATNVSISLLELK